MKNFKLITAIFIFCFLLICASAKAQDDSAWTKVDENNYIDYEAVVGSEDMYGYSFLLKSYNKGQYESVNGKTILYTLGQYELNCGKRSYRLGIIDSYDKQGNFVNGDYNKYSQFQPVVEGTAVWVVASKLCKL